MSRRQVAVLVAASVWTLVVWGSRIGLLTPEEAGEPRTWFRVGLGLAFGLAVGWTALRARRALRAGASPAGPSPDRLDGWLLFAFALWSVLIWVPDVIDLFTETRDLGFVLVHLALAAVSLAFGFAAARIAQRLLAPGRHAGDGPA